MEQRLPLYSKAACVAVCSRIRPWLQRGLLATSTSAAVVMVATVSMWLSCTKSELSAQPLREDKSFDLCTSVYVDR